MKCSSNKSSYISETLHTSFTGTKSNSDKEDNVTICSSSNKQCDQSLRDNQSKISDMLLLLFYSIGICSCHLSYGILHERLVVEVGTFTTFILTLQFISNIVVSGSCIKLTNQFFNKNNKLHGEARQGLNHSLFMRTSFFFFVATVSSNESLRYVSYPTAVLAKSSKLIPVMLVGLLFEHNAYSTREWIGAALITGGIFTFNFSQMRSDEYSNKKNDNSMYGLLLLALSLCMDGLLALCQNRMKNMSCSTTKKNSVEHSYRTPTALETMFWTNAYSLLFILPISIWSGQFLNGILHIQLSFNSSSSISTSLILELALLNMAAAGGQIFIFLTINHFSTLICTTITTTRKFCTLLLSVSKFGHIFTSFQWTSIFIVFGGLYLEIATKISKGEPVVKKAKKL